MARIHLGDLLRLGHRVFVYSPRRAAELVAKEFDAVDARSEESVRRIGQMLRTATDEARAKAAEVSGDDPTTGPVRAV